MDRSDLESAGLPCIAVQQTEQQMALLHDLEPVLFEQQMVQIQRVLHEQSRLLTLLGPADGRRYRLLDRRRSPTTSATGVPVWSSRDSWR
ncbi:unnamed protein product [Lota lota]